MVDPHQFPSQTAVLNGIRYFYIDQPPIGKYKGTAVLVHGWPDSWYGWRHQIPYLSRLGYRVLCISQLGYGGGTDTPEALTRYTFKSVCRDLACLLAHVDVKRAVFFGHDWGGAVVYRMANYYPLLVRALVVVSTPYAPPAKGRYQSLEEQAQVSPNFRYQVYLASDAPSRDFTTAADFRQFFNVLFQPGKGMKLQFSDIAALEKDTPPTTLMSAEELEVYVAQYAAMGLRGSTNWYRTRRLNYDDDQRYLAPKDVTLQMPVLFIATEDDPVLKPEYSKHMETFVPNLMRGSVKSGHWGLVECKAEVNAYAAAFLDKLELEQTKHAI